MFKLSLLPLPALLAAGMRALVLGGGILEGDTDVDAEVRLVSSPVRGLGRRFLAIWAGGGESPTAEELGAAAVVSVHDEPRVIRAALEGIAPAGWVGETATESVRLTPRERGILSHVSTGATSREIARALGISERTVEVHRRNLLKKLGVPRSAGLVGLVVRGQVAVAS